MKNSIVKKAGVLLAAFLLLVILPMSSLAEKGSISGISLKKATPSNAETGLHGGITESGIGSDLAGKLATPSDMAKVSVEDLAGTWTVDGVTTYQFEADGSGSMILPKHTYSFKFTVEDDLLSLQFENSRIGKADFSFAMIGDILKLEREEEAGTAEFTLQRTDE